MPHHKHKEKEKARSSGSSQWSEWLRDPENRRYYSWRTDANGETEYDYRYDADTPRTADKTTDIPQSPTSLVDYTQSTYKYGTDSLTRDFASTSLGQTGVAGQSTISTAPYDNVSFAPYPSTNSAGGAGYGQQSGQSGYGQYSTSTTGQSTPYGTGSSATPYYMGNTASMTNAGPSTPFYPSNNTRTPTAGPSTPFYPSSNTGNPQTANGYQEGSGDLTLREAIVPILITPNPRNQYGNFDPTNFKIHSSKEFKAGVVFQVLWTEPKGETSYQYSYNSVTEHHHETADKNKTFTKMRRFIVTGTGVGHSQCVPILTYQGQATKKYGVRAEQHAVVYMKGSTPSTLEGESSLPNRAIEITPKTPRDKLERASRILYAKLYTVEHNLKIHIIGKVSHGFRDLFVTDSTKIQQTINRSFD